MRTLLAILFVALLAAAPLAIAERGSDKARGHASDDRAELEAEANHADDDNETDENETEDDADDDANATHQHRARDGRAESEARRAEAEGLHANRSALVESFVARLQSFRTSWLENASAVREACHAQAPDGNASDDEHASAAHCVRDGYAEWRAERRAELKELRLELLSLFQGHGRGRGSSD